MKHLKKFERIQEDDTLNNLKKGDKVVFIDGSSKLNYGETYIINSLLKVINGEDVNIDTEKVKDCDLITVKNLNDDIILYNGNPMVFYPHRFTSELKYTSKKYNL